jgi:hypothetical protein
MARVVFKHSFLSIFFLAFIASGCGRENQVSNSELNIDIFPNGQNNQTMGTEVTNPGHHGPITIESPLPSPSPVPPGEITMQASPPDLFPQLQAFESQWQTARGINETEAPEEVDLIYLSIDTDFEAFSGFTIEDLGFTLDAQDADGNAIDLNRLGFRVDLALDSVATFESPFQNKPVMRLMPYSDWPSGRYILKAFISDTRSGFQKRLEYAFVFEKE